MGSPRDRYGRTGDNDRSGGDGNDDSPAHRAARAAADKILREMGEAGQKGGLGQRISQGFADAIKDGPALVATTVSEGQFSATRRYALCRTSSGKCLGIYYSAESGADTGVITLFSDGEVRHNMISAAFPSSGMELFVGDAESRQSTRVNQQFIDAFGLNVTPNSSKVKVDDPEAKELVLQLAEALEDARPDVGAAQGIIASPLLQGERIEAAPINPLPFINRVTQQIDANFGM